MKQLIQLPVGVPLLGTVMFGVIDRGSNLLQIRATTVCNLSCTFCSTDGGPHSKSRSTDYIVDLESLLSTVRQICAMKGDGVECNIDSVGEPTLYPRLLELIEGLRAISQVSKISMQTNGTMLTPSFISRLKEAGLDHINLSIHTLDPEQAKELMGSKAYNLSFIVEAARAVASSGMELCLTPVWMSGVNDLEIPRLIQFAKELGVMIAIQKYEVYKFSRKVRGVAPLTYWKFYRQLEAWEKEFNVKLKIGPHDFAISPRPRIAKVFRTHEKVRFHVVAKGWQKDQMIGVARGRSVSILDCNAPVGSTVVGRILEDKNNISVAKKI